MYYDDYDDYLKSSKWERKRKKVLERDNHTCCRCHVKKKLNVHHINYRTWGQEGLWDLATLCRDCHKYVHDVGDNHKPMLEVRHEYFVSNLFSFEEADIDFDRYDHLAFCYVKHVRYLKRDSHYGSCFMQSELKDPLFVDCVSSGFRCKHFNGVFIFDYDKTRGLLKTPFDLFHYGDGYIVCSGNPIINQNMEEFLGLWDNVTGKDFLLKAYIDCFSEESKNKLEQGVFF